MTGYIAAEGIEHALRASNIVGAGFVICFEAGFMIWDLSKCHSQRVAGDISRNDFVQSVTRRVGQAILTATGSAIVGFGSEAPGATIGTLICPGIGTAIGAMVFGVIGGVIGGVVGAGIGNSFGNIAGGAIAALIKYDDVSVKDIKHLRLGDHVVLCSHLFHPRCHALFICHDGRSKICVVRSTHERGVVEEWLDFVRPLYKVTYKDGECIAPEETIRIACLHIGKKNRYNILSNNCKHFALRCKEKRR